MNCENSAKQCSKSLSVVCAQTFFAAALYKHKIEPHFECTSGVCVNHSFVLLYLRCAEPADFFSPAILHSEHKNWQWNNKNHWCQRDRCKMSASCIQVKTRCLCCPGRLWNCWLWWNFCWQLITIGGRPPPFVLGFSPPGCFSPEIIMVIYHFRFFGMKSFYALQKL